jgi:hypothetical protein
MWRSCLENRILIQGQQKSIKGKRYAEDHVLVSGEGNELKRIIDLVLNTEKEELYVLDEEFLYTFRLLIGGDVKPIRKVKIARGFKRVVHDKRREKILVQFDTGEILIFEYSAENPEVLFPGDKGYKKALKFFEASK